MIVAYEKRWAKVVDVKPDIYANVLETEAVWGRELQDLLKPIFALEHELFRTLQIHIEIQNPKTPEHRLKSLSERQRKRRDVLYDSLSDDDDDVFKSDFRKHLTSVEEYLRGFLAI